MPKILVEKPTKEQLDQLCVEKWGTWQCDVSEFNWAYDNVEICYILEGELEVRANGENVKIVQGDLVTFPKGLKCQWIVKKPIIKMYKFED